MLLLCSSHPHIIYQTYFLLEKILFTIEGTQFLIIGYNATPHGDYFNVHLRLALNFKLT